MDEFAGKTVDVEYVQEAGWKRPVKISIERKPYAVKEVIAHWEEHTLDDPWWRRRHRVYYHVLLENGKQYEMYWDRGASGEGKEWVLLKELSDGAP